MSNQVFGAIIGACIDVVLLVIIVIIVVKVNIFVVAYKKRKEGRSPVNMERAKTIRFDAQQLQTIANNFTNLLGLGGRSSVNLEFHKFLNDTDREKPIRFDAQQLKTATHNFTHLLGSGGFGAVYKGIFGNGVLVAVKVLNGSSDKRIEEQLKAEVITIGRIHHVNLVRLYGYCFERNLRALVYEYMENGSLDKLLFNSNEALIFEKLHEISVGTARGIAYLHEECQQCIIHYDIKPGNVLLDQNFLPKVADFSLAKVSNRDNTHISLTGGRGTPGYAAPELWQQFSVIPKCDVYSFGMLLFEIIGMRKNHDINLPDSQEWFPGLVWKKFESKELGELMVACGIDEKYKEIVERMVNVALWCTQYRPESRPSMSVVVKMLEGVWAKISPER